MTLPFSADIFHAKSESIASLLPDIDSHRAALPNFQREWVWEPHMVKALIVSVANRYPAGSLLTLPASGETFALRPFSGSGKTLPSIPSLLILDGQQRLTSLYQALYSRDGIRDAKGGRHFIYLDVPGLMGHDTDASQQESAFEDSLFLVAENRYGQRQRYRGLRDYEDITTREQELAMGALPLWTVFHPDELNAWRDQYIDGRSGEVYSELKRLQREWEVEVLPWLVRIRDYRFPVIELNRDMPLHAICHIFEKVNSTGVPLTVFELCTAILWAQGFHLNERWQETRQPLHDDQVLRMQGPLDGATFLQVISLLATLDRKRDAPDTRIAVTCRREELLRLKRETIERWWSVATIGYREASRFMEDQGIIGQRILPYGSILVTLAAIMGYRKHLGGHLGSGEGWPKIERWYWSSVFAQRYSSSVEATAALDFEQVILWLEGGDEPDAVRSFSFASDRLQDIATIRSAVYKGVLCLLAKNGAKDFGGEGTLSVNLFYDSQHDHHHIFPVNALNTLGIVDGRADSIVNRTLIGASTNRSIGGRLPSAYLQTLATRLTDERTHAILRSHLIDPATLLADDWEDFFLSRREELKELIHTACGGQMQEFSDGLRVSLPRQIERLTNHVRDIELDIRELIVHTVDAWSEIPSHIRDRVDARIDGEQRANPGIERARFATVEGRLPYCDLRNLEEIIVSKPLWHLFVDVFGSKERLSTRFGQLAPLRNAHAHLREIDDLTRSDAEAAVIWFTTALARADQTRTLEPTEVPMEDEPEREVDAVPVNPNDLE